MFLATHGVLRSGGFEIFSDTHSFEYDGLNDYIKTLSSSGLELNKDNSFSFSAWVKLDALNLNHTIFSKMQSSGSF